MNAKDYEITKLLKGGYSYSQIATELNVSYSKISKIKKVLVANGTLPKTYKPTTTTTTTRKLSKLPKHPRETISKNELDDLWSIYNTISRRRCISNNRLDQFFHILQKLQKEVN